MQASNFSSPEPSNIHWPAEWEPQAAVWFSWPHRKDLWNNSLAEVQQSFCKIITEVSKATLVRINAPAHLHHEIRNTLTAQSNERVELFPHPTNDVWCRDHGATWVRQLDKKKTSIVDWKFNGWGGKFPPWDMDNAIPERTAESLGYEQEQYTQSSLHLEGGAIEGNGESLVITTEAVALNSNRNPDWSKADVEKELRRCLGTESVFWLPAGIVGDDTDGHIDDLTRFISKDALVNVIEHQSNSPNYQILQENRERLKDIRTITGSSIEIIDLPIPEPLRMDRWRLETLPASYANFLISNQHVFVPTFDQAKLDDRALGILRECFSNYKVIGVDCRNIVLEGGAIHCISQQEISP